MNILAVGTAEVESLKGALAQAKKEVEAKPLTKRLRIWRQRRLPTANMKLQWPKSSRS